MTTMSRKRATADDVVVPQRSKRQRRPSQDDERTCDEQAMEDACDNTRNEAYTPSTSPAITPDNMSVIEGALSVADTSITSATQTTGGKGRRPKVFVCNWEGCSKAFDRPARVQIHLRSHTNERPFQCPEEGCDKKFIRNEHLAAHTKSKHTDDRQHLCTYLVRAEDSSENECGKSFHTATRLKRHIAMHEEKEDKKCHDCGQIFRKQETLQRHIKSVHLHEPAYRCDHAEGDDEECGQSFKTPNALNSHKAREHSGQRYFCQICPPSTPHEAQMELDFHEWASAGFSAHAELQLHIKTVHPPTCSDCGQVCESNRALKAHMEIYHTALSERAKIECTYPGCGRLFTKNGNMKVHYQTVHAKSRAFICGQTDLGKLNKVEGWDGVGCGHGFGIKANLESHIRTQHLNQPGATRPARIKKSTSSGSAIPATTAQASMLTGFGYETSRPITCLLQNCPHRFHRNYDLATHLEFHHEWTIDDVNDAMAEKEALEGGDFWIGGAELLDDHEDKEDAQLRARLMEGLQLGAPIGRVRVDAIDPALG